MPRPSTPGSSTCTGNENKPVWFSPSRRHSTVLRTGKGKPLGELKSGNRGFSLDGPGRADKALVLFAKKAPPAQKESPNDLMSKPNAPSQVPTERVPSPISANRPKTTKPPVTEETPPRSRPITKPVAAVVTPTNKPLATPGGTPKGVTKSKVATPKCGNASKPSTPTSSRSREKKQAKEETPERKVRESPKAGGSAAKQDGPKSGSRESSRWAGSALARRGRKGSPTHGRPPVKHLFLSPQLSKKTLSRKEIVRKSIENYGIWVSSASAQPKQNAPTAETKRDVVVDSGTPPPAQPTNSPEIPKRGSREASGEGIRGFFGAGPMVAPDGVGLVRDRRKCKPRGTLMVGQEALSTESDSSGAVESSFQMPPPSAASVEWMLNNNDGKVGFNSDDFSSGFHEPAVSMSISDFPLHDNQGSGSFGKEEEKRTSQEDFFDESLEQLRLSSSNDDDMYSKLSQRPQAFLQDLDIQSSESFEKEKTSQDQDVCDGALDQLWVSSPNDIYYKFSKRSQAFLQHLDKQTSESFEREGSRQDQSLEQLRLSSPNDDIYSKFTKRSQAFLQHLDNQTSESFGKERTSQEEDICNESLEQLRLSSPNDDIYSKFTKRSQAFLQHLETRQSQLTRGISFSYYNGDESFRRAEQSGGFVDSHMEYDEDITIDWRQGLPSDSSMEMTDPPAGQEYAGERNELVRSSLTFTSSPWVPLSEDNRRLRGSGNAQNWYSPNSSPWYGFSPNTPEFHRNSQLSQGGSKAIGALVASSVRRRIMTDQSTTFSSSEGNLDNSCTSLPQRVQAINPEDSSSGLSAAASSQETTSSFHFARGNRYATDMEPMPLDNFKCLTSSPIERSLFSEDLLCQTASPIDQVYTVACGKDCGVACSIDCSMYCSLECSVSASDDDEVEYASPTMGDYLSPVRHPSPSAGSHNISTDLSTLCDELNRGARAVRKSSMSRTLEELMRHNVAL